MASVEGTIKLVLEATQNGTGAYAGVVSNVNNAFRKSFANGTSSNQINAIAVFVASPAGGATTSIDLTALTDVHGNTVAMAEVRAAAFIADPDNTDIVHVVQGGANPWTTGFLKGTAPEVPINLNGALLFVNPTDGGWTVAGGSKVIGLENQSGGTAQTVTGIIWGVLS
jgi:hypothetical protein